MAPHGKSRVIGGHCQSQRESESGRNRTTECIISKRVKEPNESTGGQVAAASLRGVGATMSAAKDI